MSSTKIVITVTNQTNAKVLLVEGVDRNGGRVLMATISGLKR